MSLKFLSTHLLVLLLLLPLGGNAQASSSASTPTSATDKGRAVYFGESGRFKQVNNIYIPMRDGKSLAADVWLPKAQKRSAAILIMTPYNRKLVGAPLPDPTAELDLPDDSHYAYVLVDWRGFFGSKKAKKFFGGGMAQNGKDGHDVVAWIASQSWSNGKVVMWGPSAVGRVQYAVAGERPQNLVAISPMVAADFYSYDIFYYGGVLKKAYVDMLGTVGYGSQSKVRQNPVNNQFWRKVKRFTSHTSRIDVPMLLISGWYDLSVDTVVETFNNYMLKGTPTVKKNLRMWIGPWHHIAVGKSQQGELQFPEAEGVGAKVSKLFFDYHARGIDNEWQNSPRVCYLRMGVNEWMCAEQFPPKIKNATRLYLSSNKKLTTKPPTVTKASEVFIFNPADPSPTVGGMNAFLSKDANYRNVGMGPKDQGRVEKRKDNLVFSSGILDSVIVLEGNAELKIYLSSDQKDTDIAVRIADVFPDGRSMLVTDGIQRMCFRGGRLNNLPMEQGKVYSVDVKLSKTAYAFRKGHRIRVIVSSANYPRFDVNKNTDCQSGETSPRALIARNEIFFDHKRASVLTLPQWEGVKTLSMKLGKQIGLK